MVSESRQFVITLSCPDRLGLVSQVSGWLFENGCNIVESDQFGDVSSHRFFMRIMFEGEPTLNELNASFSKLANQLEMQYQIWPLEKKLRVMVMVSKYDHCLLDLIYRQNIQELPIEITQIVSNHEDAAVIAESENIDFLHLPITTDNKGEQEEKVAKEIADRDVDLVVLARYMRILSPEFCRRFEGRIINIHHSFLPGFKGAKPYHQAFDQGVKVIGATAHYVTSELDEGPIIEQGVERVDHRQNPSDLAEVGRDIERIVLAKAVKFHAEHRVLLNGNRTVVFD